MKYKISFKNDKSITIIHTSDVVQQTGCDEEMDERREYSTRTALRGAC